MVAVPTRSVERLARPPDATVSLAGSKSITNRALVCATLADGETALAGASRSDDSLALAGGIGRLGATVAVDVSATDGDRPGDAVIRVGGTGGALTPGPLELDCRLAGTTSRFVTALAALGDGRYRIDGAPPLRARPMGPLHAALVDLGVRLEPEGAPGHLPVVVVAGGGLAGGRVAMPGHVSSQFVTALMLVAPKTRDGIEIELTTELVSRPYLDITAAVLRRFGVSDVVVGGGTGRGRPGSVPRCRGPGRARRVVGVVPLGGRGHHRWSGGHPRVRRRAAPGRRRVRRRAGADGRRGPPT